MRNASARSNPRGPSGTLVKSDRPDTVVDAAGGDLKSWMALATPFRPDTRILPVQLLSDDIKRGRVEESMNEDVINLLWDSPH